MKRYTKWLSVSLALVMLLTLLPGCGKDPTGEGEQSGTETKDTLRVALTSEPPSLGIYDHSALISVQMNVQMFNGLMRIDNATLDPVCDLAESYSVENEVEWTFPLRKGVKFHNGDEMTSADVVASLEYAKSLPAATLYTASMSKIEAIDEYTVKITTSAPYAGLLYDLAYYYNYIVPKALIDANNDFSANPVGTGPYKLKEWNLGNYISLERHDDYFDEAHKAKIPNLVFNIIPEGTSRTIALKSGDVDFVWDVNTADVASLQNNDAITVAEVPSVDAVILFFNNDRAPFDDANLRNAIAAAINREDIIAAALNGYGSVNYIEAARAVGAKNSTIIFKHIIPNCVAPIIVQVTLRMASAIYNTSALSFLGMGVSVPSPEWGALLANGRNFISEYGYLCVIPGLAIMVTILSLNMLGDGLRDALDPRLK